VSYSVYTAVTFFISCVQKLAKMIILISSFQVAIYCLFPCSCYSLEQEMILILRIASIHIE